MYVLHVALGLPPLRTGGLTRYCTELMQAQLEEGYQVGLLYPGRFAPGKTRLRRSWWQGVTTYEVINPLPVALTYGIAEPDAFTVTCDEPKAYENLLKNEMPNVIHVHSYMGIHREFFFVAKKLGIRIVFTTHDYYPICPRCTLVDACGNNCDEGPERFRCAACNHIGGMTLRKSMVMQSALYKAFKGSRLFGFVAGKVKGRMSARQEAADLLTENCPNGVADSYGNLLAYNRDIFSLFDCVICNSSMTERLYRSVFPGMSYCKVPITHAGLERSPRTFCGRSRGSELHIGYFGGNKRYKGIGVLMDAAAEVARAGFKFSIELYGDEYQDIQDYPYIKKCGRIRPDDMRGILERLDVVIVPSICRETFGFVVLEALCAETPVICSDAVGASELVSKSDVFASGAVGELAGRISHYVRARIEPPHLPDGYPLSMDEQINRLNGVYSALSCRENR